MSRARSKRVWYLVRCKSGQECTARDRLQEQGYSPYLPMMVEVKMRKHRVMSETQPRPLFATYLFVHIDPELKSLRPLAATRGVLGVVRFGELMATVPAAAIDALRKAEDEQGLHRVSSAELRKGERVRIVDGAFAGMEGILVADQQSKQVVISLGMVQRMAMASSMVQRC